MVSRSEDQPPGISVPHWLPMAAHSYPWVPRSAHGGCPLAARGGPWLRTGRFANRKRIDFERGWLSWPPSMAMGSDFDFHWSPKRPKSLNSPWLVKIETGDAMKALVFIAFRAFSMHFEWFWNMSPLQNIANHGKTEQPPGKWT